ncbi:MAG: sugar ABC transporter ATP-binding protein [Planctomycetota bacterium]
MRGVAKAFGPTIALAGVDLEVAPGEVHALIGENGAGKSTLMKALAGAHQPDTGEMFLDGKPYTPDTPAAGRDAGVAMIYQELSLAPELTVAENIFLGIEPHIGPFLKLGEMRRRTKEALAQIGLDDLDPGAIVGTLSNAKQQLVEIARALIFDCRLLVLDEPTSSLTAKDIEKLFKLIRTLKSRGISIVYISHFLEEINEITDRFTVLRDGQTVGKGVTADTPTDQIIAMMVGRDVKDLYPRSERTPGEVVLEVSGLAGKLGLPANATLSLRRGEVLGVAGLMGAGRTEMARCIFGLDPVREGTIKVGGDPLMPRPDRGWKRGVGFLSEDRKTEGLATELSIADNTTLARLAGLGPAGLVTPGNQARACQPWIKKIPIKCFSAHAPVSSLSGGNQQKVAIARLLHADCDVLILDEPTRGIDVGSKAQVYKLIDDLAQGDPERGIAPKAVLMISSYLPELLGTCDRIQVMCRGVLGESHDIDKTDEHKIMMEATGAA